MIRTFIAFDLENDETRNNLSNFIERLKLNQPKIKFVEPENYHMTVKFLGNINETLAPKIYQILKEEINEGMFGGKSYNYVLKGIGQFRSYSVLWVKLVGDTAFLQEIKNRIEDSLNEKLKIPRDKRSKFEPHMTIGRVKKQGINYKTFDSFKSLILDNKDTEYGSFPIDGVKLKKSVLTPKGPIYSDLVYQ